MILVHRKSTCIRFFLSSTGPTSLGQGGALVVVRQERGGGGAGAPHRGPGACDRRPQLRKVLEPPPHHRRLRPQRRLQRLGLRRQWGEPGGRRGERHLRRGADCVVPPPGGRRQGTLRLRIPRR